MNNKIKNTIIIGGVILLIIIIIIALFLTNGNKTSPKFNKSTIDTDFSNTVDEKAEKAMLEIEKQKLVDALNRSLLPNYLKITKWKEYPRFGTYADDGVTFFLLELSPNTSNEALADYDIRILKGSEDEEDFNTKSQLYKDKTKNLLINMLKNGQYGKLIDNGIIGTIKRLGKNKYKIDFLGDYIYDKYGTNKNLKIETTAKIALLRDYFNFGNIYLSKTPDDFLKILIEVDNELQNKNFSELSKVLKKVYFKDIGNKK